MEALSDLREELDELEGFRFEDLSGVGNDKVHMPDDISPDVTDPEDDDVDSTIFAEYEMEVAAEMIEDESAVTAVENEIEIAADMIEDEGAVAAADNEMEVAAEMTKDKGAVPDVWKKKKAAKLIEDEDAVVDWNAELQYRSR